MIIEGDNFKYFFNNEEKTKEEIEQLAEYATSITVNGCSVNYFSPKKENKKAYNYLDKIQELLKEADEHQKQNGGILEGTEFPFDTVLTPTKSRFPKYEKINLQLVDDKEIYKILWSQEEIEQKVIEDWNKADLPPYKETPLGELLEDWCNQLTGEKESKIAYKETEGKLFYELDWGFITQMAERMASNKKESKYDLWNWKKTMTPKGIVDLKQATLRHLLAVLDENYEDDGREFGHIEAIADNMMMINYQLKNNQK